MIDLRDTTQPAARVIAALGLSPHPEGGHYRETWRDARADGQRGAGTAILFLLAAGESSHWHRIDATECWHWQAGGPLALALSADGHAVTEHRLGPDLGSGETLFVPVPPGVWQAARPCGSWALVACTVAPAFTFAGFEMAPPGWQPAAAR